MATDLTTEYREGMDSKLDDACPYMATSDCADAWWVGRMAYALRYTANMRCGRATRGRGNRINIITPSNIGKAVMRVDWNTPTPEPLVTFA